VLTCRRTSNCWISGLSKNRRGGILHFTQAEWDAFIGGVRNGEFDRRQSNK
jgi:hypothetical protein